MTNKVLGPGKHSRLLQAACPGRAGVSLPAGHRRTLSARARRCSGSLRRQTKRWRSSVPSWAATMLSRRISAKRWRGRRHDRCTAFAWGTRGRGGRGQERLRMKGTRRGSFDGAAAGIGAWGGGVVGRHQLAADAHQVWTIMSAGHCAVIQLPQRPVTLPPGKLLQWLTHCAAARGPCRMRG
jgi:hypothetical protein